MRVARPVTAAVCFLAAAVSLLGGCGSKISGANYYRVQYGMGEEAVEDLLGPAHREELAADIAPSAGRKVKVWSRDGLTLRVAFEGGLVTGRSAEGLTFESGSRVPPATSVARR